MLLKGMWYNIIHLNICCPIEEKEDNIRDEFYSEVVRLLDGLQRCVMKIIIVDFNAKIGKEESILPMIGMKSLYEAS